MNRRLFVFLASIALLTIFSLDKAQVVMVQAQAPKDAISGAWTTTTPLPQAFGHAPAVVYNGRIYIAGGEGTSGTIRTTVYYATIQADGSVSAWNTTTALALPIHYHAMVAANDYLYIIGPIGGPGGSNVIHRAFIKPDGTLGNWLPLPLTPLPVRLTSPMAVVAGSRLYVLGGYNGTTNQDTVYYTTINADGTLASWNTTTALPQKLSFGGAVVANGRIYIAGGWLGTGWTTATYSAVMNADGTLGSWNVLSVLPKAVGNHVLLRGGNALYLAGGLDNSGSQKAVYSAALNIDGTLGSWVAMPDLPQPLHDHTGVFYGNLYILGGFNSSVGAYQSTVYMNQLPFSCATQTDIPKSECEALVAFYNSTNGSHWTDHSGWLVTNTPCQWIYVTCFNGHVETLDPDQNNLNGSLPAEIGNLTQLDWLSVSNNQLSGALPATIGNLTSLSHVYLDHNSFSGALQDSLRNLTALDTFQFNNTNLCEPADTAFQNWLASIPNLQRTSVPCSTPLFSISGRVTNGAYFEKQVVVDARTEWFNTDVTVQTGDQVQIKYLSGTWTIWKGVDPYTDANGQTGRKDPCTFLPSANTSGLVGRVGTGNVQFIGSMKSFTAQSSASLFLSINDCTGQFQNNDGTLTLLVSVISGANTPIEDVTISAGAGQPARSDANGNYTLPGLAAGTYTLTPSKSGYTFSPTSLSVTVPPDVPNMNFVGTLLPTNRSPIANDQNVTTAQNTPVNITLTASDTDGDPLTYSIVSNPANGQLTGTAPNLIYTPRNGFSGSDSFTFKANDGKTDSNIATISITVTASQMCGPMDVAFIVDTTTSMDDAIVNVKTELAQILGNIETASENNYQLALVTFNDTINILENFTANNRSLIEPKFQALSTRDTGSHEPEASDEALNTVVNALPAAGRSQNIDFSPAFRTEAVKIIILVTDARPGGFNDAFTPGEDDVNAHNRAIEASAHGMKISAIFVPTNRFPEAHPTVRTVMQDYATTTNGVFIETTADGSGTGAAINEIIAQCGSTPSEDSDGDGLLNDWETEGGGIDADQDGHIDLDLYALGARANRRDIFVEIDFMLGERPSNQSINDVKSAFAQAPVWDEDIDGDSAPGHVPTGIEPGVNLIYKIDEEVPTQSLIHFGSSGPGAFDDIYDYRYGSNNLIVVLTANDVPRITQKQGLLDPTRICGDAQLNPTIARFGTDADRKDRNCVNIIRAKSMVYRYALFGRTYQESSSSTGISILGSNLLFIAQDNLKESNKLAAESGTFMHELGHTVGLDHGGKPESADTEDAYNCKPNYFSVMNYYYQFPSADPTRPLDYSSWQANTLNENNLLDERVGVRSPTPRKVLFGSWLQNRMTALPMTNEPINWNRNDRIDTELVSADVNVPHWLAIQPGVTTCGVTSAGTPNQELKGHDDWAVLDYNFRDSAMYPYGGSSFIVTLAANSTGASLPAEPTAEELQTLGYVVDYDADGYPNSFDNCPAIANPDQHKPEGVDCGVSFDLPSRLYLPLTMR